MFRAAPWMVLLLAAILSPCLAATDGLVDPTLPPMTRTGGENGAEGAALGPILQSVLMAPGRKFATINGQTLRVGDRFGDATLIRVSDREAVLRNVDGTLQILKMQPAVDKTDTPLFLQDRASIKHDKKRPAQPAEPGTR